jgi:FtsP/CotA-like multicopper oxidase with cupredoxin domain
MMPRRTLLTAGLAAGAVLPLARGAGALDLWPAGAGARLPETRLNGAEVILEAAPHDLPLQPGARPSNAWLYGRRPFPLLRVRRGETATVTVRNRLAQHTSIHWHGVRVPNAMDGVPYLTQDPVWPDKTFTYRFAPPDAGTYFFHPHCNTAEQLGRGLLGALIVEDDEPAAFDDDLVLVLKDWDVDARGGFTPFLTLAGASRSGTFGALRTVNGRPSPRIRVPAAADLRLRLINADSTRICSIAIEGADAAVVAIDGNPISPFALETWRLGPGMRLDLALRTPASGAVRLVDDFAAEPFVLAVLTAGGRPVRSRPFDPPALPSGLSAAPDLEGAIRQPLELGAGVIAQSLPDPSPVVLPDGRRIDLADSLCLGSATLWTLDGRSWPERDHRRLPPPLMSVRRGQTVVLEIFNATSRAHPIHLHGHTMTILSTSLLKRPVHRADTVLVEPNERIEAAFVAEQPGAWMLHCHVVEHQETGMMAWLLVS